MMGKTNLPGRCESSSVAPKGTLHMSYLSGSSNQTIKNVKKIRRKEKSPLEKAKNTIKKYHEQTGTGKIVKKVTRKKISTQKNKTANNYPSTIIARAISSPTFKNINGSSTPLKCHEKSFDTSAQIEEIFDIQQDEDSNIKKIVIVESSSTKHLSGVNIKDQHSIEIQNMEDKCTKDSPSVLSAR